jgi:hypothetical protein
MLRTIAEIARENGEDLSDPETRLACLEVFALGSRAERTTLASGGYFAVRAALAKSVTQAAKLAAAQGLADASAPALVRFMAQIASRFGVVVSQKVAASAGADPRRPWGRGRERGLPRAFPRGGAGPLHDATAGAHIRAGCREGFLPFGPGQAAGRLG